LGQDRADDYFKSGITGPPVLRAEFTVELAVYLKEWFFQTLMVRTESTPPNGFDSVWVF
jgi:hypothetical protein